MKLLVNFFFLFLWGTKVTKLKFMLFLILENLIHQFLKKYGLRPLSCMWKDCAQNISTYAENFVEEFVFNYFFLGFSPILSEAEMETLGSFQRFRLALPW